LALERMLHHVSPGGLILASIRDYDSILEQRPAATIPTLSTVAGERRVTFQLWQWSNDDRSYELELFVLREITPGTLEYPIPPRALPRDHACGAHGNLGTHRARVHSLDHARGKWVLSASRNRPPASLIGADPPGGTSYADGRATGEAILTHAGRATAAPGIRQHTFRPAACAASAPGEV
jgi:hypothetical protein